MTHQKSPKPENALNLEKNIMVQPGWFEWIVEHLVRSLGDHYQRNNLIKSKLCKQLNNGEMYELELFLKNCRKYARVDHFKHLIAF